MPKFAAFAIIFAVTVSPARGQISETTGKTASRVLTWDVVSIKPHNPLDDNAMTQTLPDRFEMKNMGIHSVVSQAFPIRSGDEIVGWPAWTNSARFDFRAKMDAETAEAFRKLRGSDSSNMWRLMFRQLLEKRMGPKYHMEKRELPVYDLVIAKHGPKVKVSAADEQSTSQSSPGWLSAHRTPASGLAGMLSGLTGLYDI